MSNSIKRKIYWEREELWRGCILSSIAHAIMVAHYPDLSNEESWDGINYNIQDSQGTRGTLTFYEDYCIGAFRNDNSVRVEDLSNIKLAQSYFTEAPKIVVEVANNETLQYLLDNINGNVMPVITTSFWSEKDNFFTVDSEEDFYNNGSFILETQLMQLEDAISTITDDYEMSSNQVSLLRKLFDLKANKKIENITLSKEDISKIESDDEEGIEESKISFEEIGIFWELQ